METDDRCICGVCGCTVITSFADHVCFFCRTGYHRGFVKLPEYITHRDYTQKEIERMKQLGGVAYDSPEAGIHTDFDSITLKKLYDWKKRAGFYKFVTSINTIGFFYLTYIKSTDKCRVIVFDSNEKLDVRHVVLAIQEGKVTEMVEGTRYREIV